MINTMNDNTKISTSELGRLNADEVARNIAKIRELDAIYRKLEYDAGVEAARTQGKIEGIIEGRIAEKLEIAKRMLNDNYDIPEINALTELSKDEIIQLLKEPA